MAVVADPALKRAVESAWEEAVSSFSSLEKNGTLGSELWAMLQTQTDPQDLLRKLQQSPYAKLQDMRPWLRLAECCIDAVARFDKEIGMVMQGVSNCTIGTSCIVWGGLGIVFHLSQDLFKIPEVIVEIIAKIFAMMPRIDVYFDLFKDQKDVLDIRPLLVAIYKCIVEFNVKCVKWHGGLRAKGRKLLKEDPRTSFKDIFVKMTDASEEMRKQAEAIGLKRQVVAHNDLVDRLAKMEHDQQQGLKGLRDDLIQKRHEETSQQLELAARKAEEARLANEKVISEGKEKEKARKAQEESLKPFLQGSSLRQQLWRLLHEPPWSVIAESQVNGLIDMDSASKSPKGKYWQDGTYQMQYPVEDPVAEVFLTIDWKADTDPTHPSIKWVMDTPDSLFYPGKHVGRMEVKKSDFSSNYPPNLFDSRLKVYWESGTFSSIPNPRVGLLSSDGPLEEAMVPHILTCTLQSIAHILIMGPLSKSTPQTGFGWHDMDRGIARYFASNDEDVSMRACAFFSNAFTRDIEGLDDLSHMELLESCREASKMAIRELASFFKIDTEIAENADRDRSWVLDDSYAKASSQIDWVLQDRLWAGRIAQLARHERLIKASNCFQPPSKISVVVRSRG